MEKNTMAPTVCGGGVDDLMEVPSVELNLRSEIPCCRRG